MTYCLGIKIKSGLVGISDRRITSGTDTTRAKKLFIHNRENHSIFIMTSGLRSVRDKAITYFKEAIEEDDQNFNKLYKAVNAFATQVRRVAQEDNASLEQSGVNFNLYAIVGGQLEDDPEHKLFMLYPQGNWIEVGEGTPFFIIGNSGYGVPILNRGLTFRSEMEYALKIGFLSFDAIRISSNDVEYPIDVILYTKDSPGIVEQRYDKEELEHVSKFRDKSLSNFVQELPDEWTERVFHQLSSKT